jgi:hypothetical protein
LLDKAILKKQVAELEAVRLSATATTMVVLIAAVAVMTAAATLVVEDLTVVAVMLVEDLTAAGVMAAAFEGSDRSSSRRTVGNQPVV